MSWVFIFLEKGKCKEKTVLVSKQWNPYFLKAPFLFQNWQVVTGVMNELLVLRKQYSLEAFLKACDLHKWSFTEVFNCDYKRRLALLLMGQWPSITEDGMFGINPLLFQNSKLFYNTVICYLCDFDGYFTMSSNNETQSQTKYSFLFISILR